ncbi:hypothetical protein BH23VER1_BH23VER1_26490 [soil metagenome]
MVWSNPIFRRYCRSRLRPTTLGLGLLIVLILAGFIFFMARTLGSLRSDFDPVDVARFPLIPLLVLQGLILFFIGTGQTAGGMTTEADEGTLDYQRLAPMTPLAKVLGYLFGLPVREYVLFLATLPFTAWSLWRGEVPAHVAAQLYGVFLSSAILYHLTGLVAGTVVRNRRFAFLISIGTVILLYTVVPQMANFGLVYFRYLTIRPVIEECLPHLIPRDAGAGVATLQSLVKQARFFDLGLPEYAFTLLCQGVFALTMVVMLWRRWRRAESHLLGKAWATGLYAWIQVLLLGNALPLIEPGHLFISRTMARRFFQFRESADWSPAPTEAVAMASAYGIVSLIFIWVLSLMITPNAENQTRGWRRARKLGRRSLAPASDPATAFWWVLAMALVGAAGWYLFASALIGSRWFPGREMPAMAAPAFVLAFLTGGLCFHALLEGRGAKATVLTVIFIGVVPVFVGTVVGTAADRLIAPATWLVGLSPASGPAYASTLTLPTSDLPPEFARAAPRAFWFWQGIAALATAALVAHLRRSRIAAALAANDSTPRSAGDKHPAPPDPHPQA